MKQGALIGLWLLAASVVVGCRTKVVPSKYDRPLPPGELALRKITDPNQYPDFAGTWRNLDSLKAAAENSLNYLSKPSSHRYFPYGDVSHERVVQTLEKVLTFIDSGVRGSELNGVIHAYFDVYKSVGWDGKGTVLFTGYYTPIFDGSFERTERFRYPLYQMPDNLVKDDEGRTLGLRGAEGRLTPVPPRSEIEASGLLEGQELVWLSDPFEVYIAHVQGSAKLKTPDGRLVTVGYAANSGHEYVSVAQALVADRRIPPERMSLATMIDYFKRHPGQVARYTQRNPRYVFFRLAEGPPHGSLNESVTPLRTIATDKSIFPRAALAFIATSPSSPGRPAAFRRAYDGFVLDQDTGGAIRAAGRCDVYMGEGDRAGQLAGQTYQEGRLYYLFLKSG